MTGKNRNNGLIKRESSDLKKSEFNMQILESILPQSIDEYERLVDFFKDYSYHGLRMFLKYHPIDHAKLQEFKKKFPLKKSYLDSKWEDLARNENLFWTLNLLNEFENQDVWTGISESNNVDWSLSLLERFEQKFDRLWWRLSSNESLPFSKRVVNQFSEKWDWDCLSSNRSFIKNLFP